MGLARYPHKQPGRMMRGDKLPRAQRRAALEHFTDRFTGEHTPAWVRELWRQGEYPRTKYRTDGAWLRAVWIRRTRHGMIDRRFKDVIEGYPWRF